MWSVVILGPKIFGLWWSVVVCGVQADRNCTLLSNLDYCMLYWVKQQLLMAVLQTI